MTQGIFQSIPSPPTKTPVLQGSPTTVDPNCPVAGGLGPTSSKCWEALRKARGSLNRRFAYFGVSKKSGGYPKMVVMMVLSQKKMDFGGIPMDWKPPSVDHPTIGRWFAIREPNPFTPFPQHVEVRCLLGFLRREGMQKFWSEWFFRTNQSYRIALFRVQWHRHTLPKSQMEAEEKFCPQASKKAIPHLGSRLATAWFL